MSGSGSPFWIDHAEDREWASDGRSRYGAYVRMNAVALAETADLFEAGPDRAVAFAVEAWRVATGPVMAPAYVRSHRRVIDARVLRSLREPAVVAEVELVAPRPQVPRSSRDWRRPCPWFDWPTTPAGSFHLPEPAEDDLSSHSYLLTTVKALFAIDSRVLPDPHLDAIEESADAAVAVLVEQLNAVVTPILAQLEQS